VKKAYQVRKRKVVFSKGPIHLVDCEVEMPDGSRLSRQIIEHPGAVVIIPRVSKERYLLIRQFRFAAKGWLWEFPAGGIERGESLKKAARRELIEETGFRPRKLTKLLQFYPTPGISGEIMYLFLAEHLVPDYAPCDADEDIEVKEFSLSTLESMMKRGEIVDGKTILSYMILKDRNSSALTKEN